VTGLTIPEFMSREVRNADKILAVCSPQYRQKVHAMEDGQRISGAGWESMLVTSNIWASRTDRNKIIPVLFRGAWREAAPDVLIGLPYFDLSNMASFETNYRELLRSLTGQNEPIPPLGRLPELAAGPIEPLRGKEVGSFAELLLQKHQLDTALRTLKPLSLGPGASENYKAAVKQLTDDLDSIDHAITEQRSLERAIVLPPRPRCIARNVYLESIQNYIEDDKWRPPTISIEGPGGIGKTVLALEAAHRFKQRGTYNHVIWVSAKREEFVDGVLTPIDKFVNTFVDVLEAIGEAYGLKEFASISTPARKQSMIEKYMAATKTLLIVDNLETVPQWELDIVSKFFATLPAPSRVLCTSRRAIRHGALPIRLDSFSESDTHTLIQTISADRGIELTPNVIREIYGITQGLPLAVCLLTGLTCHRWSGESNALKRIQSMPGKQLLDFIFASSYDALDQDSQKLLKVVALFYEKSAPSKEAARIVAELDERAAERAEDQLFDLSLFDDPKSDNENCWNIHPMLRTFVRDRTELDEKRAFAEGFARYLEKLDANRGIYVFTRDYEWKCVQGKQPTVLDFAFLIHSQVGERITKALVNGDEVEFEKPLQHGNMIEIIVSNRPARFTREYLEKLHNLVHESGCVI
jgi:hypothetical protein